MAVRASPLLVLILIVLSMTVSAGSASANGTATAEVTGPDTVRILLDPPSTPANDSGDACFNLRTSVEVFKNGSFVTTRTYDPGVPPVVTLSSGGSYFFDVEWCADLGLDGGPPPLWSARSNTVSVEGPPPPPTPDTPDFLRCNDCDFENSGEYISLDSSVALEWGDESDTTSYTVERSTNGGSYQRDFNTSGTSKTVTSLSDALYRWRVQACNGSQCSGFREISKTVRLSSQSVIASVASNTEIDIFMNPPSTDDDGCIGRNTEVRWDANLKEFPPGRNPVRVTVSRGGDFVFDVTWCVDFGLDGPGATLQGTAQVDDVIGPPPPPPPDPPDTPASLTCSSGCERIESDEYVDINRDFVLSWPAVPNTDYYDLEQAVVGGSFVDIDEDGRITGLSDNLYTYRIRACNADGCSGSRGIDRPVRVDTQPPDAPGTVTVEREGSRHLVSWTAPDDPYVDYYVIEQTYLTFTEEKTVSSTSAEFSLISEGDYTYRISSCQNGLDCGAPAVTDPQLFDLACPEETFAHINPSTPHCLDIETDDFDQQLSARIACEHFEQGTEFLRDELIWRQGLVQPDEVDPPQDGQAPPPDTFDNLRNSQGDPTYLPESLRAAESYYRCALDDNPSLEVAAEGLIDVQRARLQKSNLVADLISANALVAKYSDALGVSVADDGGVRLQAEIDILQAIVDELRDAIPGLLEAYLSPDLSGRMLRGEVPASSPDELQVIGRTLLSAVSRFARAERSRGRRTLDRDLYLSDTQGRDEVLAELDDAGAFVETVLDLVEAALVATLPVPPVGEAPANSNESLNVVAFADVARAHAELVDATTSIRLGYNPFGFVSDFVPFVGAAEQGDTTSLNTFNQMHSIASGAVADLLDVEVDICGACSPGGSGGGLLAELDRFSRANDDYVLRAQELTSSYDQRLRSLLGTVRLPGGGETVPDVYSSLIPDVDLDGDGVTERDAAREELAREGFEFDANDKGLIGQQYLIIANAEDRARAALDETADLTEQIALAEQEALEMVGIGNDFADSVFNRINEDGEQISILIEEKGQAAQKAADEAARAQRRNSFLSGIVSGGLSFGLGGAANLTSVVLSGFSQYAGTIAGAGGLESASGSAAAVTAGFDADINDIRTAQQADIVLAEALRDEEQLLAKLSYTVANLQLSINNLALNYDIAQRDVDREVQALSRQYAEAAALGADFSKSLLLLESMSDGNAVGWNDVDSRDVLHDLLLVGDQALQRAKAWTYVTLRALEYYANRPPGADGGPDPTFFLGFYRQLYFARRATDLETILQRMTDVALSGELFDQGAQSCGSRSTFSLKFDVFTTNLVNFDEAGEVIDNADDVVFRYYSPFDDVTYEGNDAYHALFRDTLRRTLRVVGTDVNGNPVRELAFEFGTNLFPPPTSDVDGVFAGNPFYILQSRNAKILGISNLNCGPASGQGVQLNLVGNLAASPVAEIYQEGNSYLKHTPWSIEDFDDINDDPMRSITVYTAYEQLMPTWLISDLGGDSVPEETIGSTVVGLVTSAINGTADDQSSVTLAFTDRSVANDRWRVVINEASNDNGKAFFDELEEMLAEGAPIGLPAERFLTDIQLLISWAFRNPN